MRYSASTSVGSNRVRKRMSASTIRPPVLRTVDPVTSPVWAQLVSTGPSTLFHSPQWMGAVQDTYGFRFFASVLEEEGVPAGGVVWSETSNLLGARCVTLPFSDFCDVLAPTPAEARILAESVETRGRPWTLRTLSRNVPEVNCPVAHTSSYKWQGIELSADTSALWENLASMAQRGVRKAERSGVEVRHATDKRELREWYLLHLNLRRSKYGLLAQPYAFFENIWDAFVERGQGFLLVAVYAGQTIAGTLYLHWKDTCYYKFNASDTEHLSLRPNNLLLWRGIVEAKERGFKLLDLGRSNAQQEGLVGFKRTFGATEEDLLSITYSADSGESKQTKEAQSLLQELTRLLVKESLPDSIVEEAGALLYPYFV